jgi:hypothetical protein
MDLSELREQVERDARIDDTELDTESLRLPQLHNKYLNLYHDQKLRLEIKSIVDYLEEVVKEITFRHTKIKNAIEWRRFLSGG